MPISSFITMAPRKLRYDPDFYHRRSIRLAGFDYKRRGAYFVTVCTWGRACLFGTIVKGRMVLNDAGRAAAECWQRIPEHFPKVELDEWVVMPNHLHGIIMIASGPVEANDHSPCQIGWSQPPWPTGTSRTIGSIVRGFKIGVTKWYRQRSGISQVWQRNYWDHVVRHERELMRIRRYVVNNPIHWDQDLLRQPASDAANQVHLRGRAGSREIWMV
jgi:REP element-mobilizing transposase RayT